MLLSAAKVRHTKTHRPSDTAQGNLTRAIAGVCDVPRDDFARSRCLAETSDGCVGTFKGRRRFSSGRGAAMREDGRTIGAEALHDAVADDRQTPTRFEHLALRGQSNLLTALPSEPSVKD